MSRLRASREPADPDWLRPASRFEAVVRFAVVTLLWSAPALAHLVPRTRRYSPAGIRLADEIHAPWVPLVVGYFAVVMVGGAWASWRTASRQPRDDFSGPRPPRLGAAEVFEAVVLAGVELGWSVRLTQAVLSVVFGAGLLGFVLFFLERV